MRGIVTLALVLGLAGGLLGTIAFSELSDRAGAAGYVTRQAEITLLADEGTALGNSPRPDYQHTWGIATIDTTTFPAGTTFTLNLAGIKGASSYCFRLAEPLGMTEDKLESIAKAAANDGAISFSPVEVTYDEALRVLRLAL